MGILRSVTRKIGKLVGAENPQDKAARNAAKNAATNSNVEAQSAVNRKFAAQQQEIALRQLNRREAKRKRGRDATIITSGTDIQSRSLLG